ncbi:MAG: hypothetical protein R3C09_00595 [Pirellulaceae bacterium]
MSGEVYKDMWEKDLWEKVLWEKDMWEKDMWEKDMWEKVGGRRIRRGASGHIKMQELTWTVG